MGLVAALGDAFGHVEIKTAAAEPDAAKGSEVEVKVKEYTIEMTASVAVGPTTFKVTNTGRETHGFEIEGKWHRRPLLLAASCKEMRLLDQLSSDLPELKNGAQRSEAAARQEPDAPAISDYALIGDCRTSALISSTGSVDWLCLPNFFGSSVFARLLDPRGGSFSLHPTEPFTATRRYVGDTAVLETTFETETGKARVFAVPAMGEKLSPLKDHLYLKPRRTPVF